MTAAFRKGLVEAGKDLGGCVASLEGMFSVKIFSEAGVCMEGFSERDPLPAFAEERSSFMVWITASQAESGFLEKERSWEEAFEAVIFLVLRKK